MNDSSEDPSAEPKPPAKRSFFARRPAPKASTDDDADFFRQSGQVFSSIIAEREEKLHQKASKKIKQKEEQEDKTRERSVKKRRISTEDEDGSEAEFTELRRQSTPTNVRTRSQTNTPTKVRKSPKRPSRDAESLERADTKGLANAADVVEIGSDNDEQSDTDTLYDAPRQKSTPRKDLEKTQKSVVIPGEVEEDDDDEEFRELIAKAKERKRQRELEEQRRAARLSTMSPSGNQTIGTDAPTATKPVLNVFIEPGIEGMKGAVIKVSVLKKIKDIREAWCKHNELSSDRSADVIITWRGHIQYDYTLLKTMLSSGAGITIDADGNLKCNGNYEGLTSDLSKVHVLATTKVLHEAKKAREKLEKQSAPPEEILPEEEIAEQVAEPKATDFRKIIMRNKEYGELKLKIRAVRLDFACGFASS